MAFFAGGDPEWASFPFRDADFDPDADEARGEGGEAEIRDMLLEFRLFFAI